ncbi:MAG: hypothetical protein KDB80_16700 [Planctomycetes bacterium]|nr:hypothetical protein [Planctomycetota bacterium]
MKLTHVITVFLTLALATFANAQGRERSVLPETPQTVKDEHGLLQWKEYKRSFCPTCKRKAVIECDFCTDKTSEGCKVCGGDREKTCIQCRGEGMTLDPLDWMMCPSCYGNGRTPCQFCRNTGSTLIEGGGDKGQKCSACKGERGFVCEVCNGERMLAIDAVFKLKPSFREAPLKDLQKVREALAKAKEELAAWQVPTDLNAKKTTTGYTKALKPALKYMPILKPLGSMCTDVCKSLDRGMKPYTRHPESMSEEYSNWRRRADFALDYGIELLDIAIARQEANAAVEAADKK